VTEDQKKKTPQGEESGVLADIGVTIIGEMIVDVGASVIGGLVDVVTESIGAVIGSIFDD
jgi:hypothetical protein